MYIDLDLHFSDGVSIPFSNSLASSMSASRILTLSIHHASPGFYPSHQLAALTPLDTSDPYTLSIPLHRGASCKSFEPVWTSVQRIKDAFEPEYVVVQCGVDGLSGDPMAVWNWGVDLNERGSMGWMVNEILQWRCRTLLLGGGGYSSPNAARAWTYLTAIAVCVYSIWSISEVETFL
jgi:histone deacetylase 8